MKEREAELGMLEARINGMNVCIEEARLEKDQASAERLDELKYNKALRLELICEIFPEVGEAYKFIDENRNIFRGKIWGPIAAEVQPKNHKTASYLEDYVPEVTLKAYVVECNEDCLLLHREVYSKRGIFIKIFVVNDGNYEARSRMYSDERMDVLRREHGFLEYLDETFTAPHPIMQALINKNNVDKVLVGGETVHNSLERKDLLNFLSTREANDRRPGKQGSCFFYTYKGVSIKFMSQASRYTGLIGTTSKDIGPARLLRFGSNPGLMDQFDITIQEADEFIAKLQPVVNATIVKLDEMNGQAIVTVQFMGGMKRALERKDEKIASLESSLEAAIKRSRTDNIEVNPNKRGEGYTIQEETQAGATMDGTHEEDFSRAAHVNEHTHESTSLFS